MLQTLQQFWQFLADWGHNQGFWVMVGALAAAASALIVLAAALVALYQLREAQKLRKDQTRPFVVIEFRVEPTSIIYLRVSNLGSTMAREIKFSVDPPLQTTRGDQWNVMELGIFRSGMKTLAPGRVIEFLFDTWIGRDQMNDRYVVKIQYRGEEGSEYKDEIDLDLGVYRNMQFIHRHDLDDIYKQIESIAKSLDSFKADWGNGLLTLSPKDLARRNEEYKRSVEEWRAQRHETPPLATSPDSGSKGE